MLFLHVSCLVSSDLRVSCLFFFFVCLGFWVLPSGSSSCSLVKSVGSWDSEGLSIEGSLGLEGLYCNPCIPTYSLMD